MIILFIKDKYYFLSLKPENSNCIQTITNLSTYMNTLVAWAFTPSYRKKITYQNFKKWESNKTELLTKKKKIVTGTIYTWRNGDSV